MSNKFTITSPSYDRVYDAYAWRNNNLTLALVQGEGVSIPGGTSSTATVSASRTKAPRFQLKDDRGVISLSSGNPEVFWAIKRPNNTEDMVSCNIVTDNTSGITADDGIIEVPITASSTQYAGDVYGEIRVVSSNGVIKFYGINASVQNGVSDDAAAQSSEFTALMQALQKVVAISTSGTANMATLHSNGELRESTDPISSANLKTFLESNYLTYLRSRFTSFKYAHEAHSSNYDAETNPVDEYNDTTFEGVYIDEATDIKTCYIIKNVNGAVTGILFCATLNNNSTSGTAQFALYYSGRLQIRRKQSGSSGSWESWTIIETQGNKDPYNSNDNVYYGISNDASKYPSSKSIRKFIDAILASVSTLDTSIKDAVILGAKTLQPDKTYNMHKDLVETYLNDSDYSNDTEYTTSALTDFDFGYESHGRPNKVALTIPTNGVEIEYYDTVTGKSWTVSTVPGSISYVNDSFYIQNLIPGHLYTYVIYDANGTALKSGSCLASGHVRMINAGGDTFNIRDLGGWACDGGSIKYGKIYRGAEINYGITITEEQRQFIKSALGVDDDVDLRSEGSIPSDTALGIGVGYSPFPLSYSDIVVTEGNVFKPASVIKHIAQNLKDGKTSYIHCRAGADRTGTVCLLLEAICGVSQNDIDRDYELTSFSKQPNYNDTRALRLRTSSFVVQNVGDYALKATIATFKSMEGTSLHDKIRRFLLRNGVTIEEMNTIRNELIDGTPSKLVSPYGSVTVSRSLSNATMDNPDNTTALYKPYKATVKALDAYKIDTVSITMGGSDVSNYYSNGVIEIPLVTGKLIISVTATVNAPDELREALGTAYMVTDTPTEGEVAYSTLPVFSYDAVHKALYWLRSQTEYDGMWHFDWEEIQLSSELNSYIYDDISSFESDVISGDVEEGQAVKIKSNGVYKLYIVQSASVEEGADYPVAVYDLFEVGSDKLVPMTFTYTIPSNSWVNNQCALSGQMSVMANGRIKADVATDQTALNQLIVDGCWGLYVSTDISGSLPVFTMHALGNTPTAAITVQITLSQTDTY